MAPKKLYGPMEDTRNPELKSPVLMHEITEWKKRSKEKYRYKIGLSNLGK